MFSAVPVDRTSSLVQAPPLTHGFSVIRPHTALFLAAMLAATTTATTTAAQTFGRDSLPPRAFWRLAMQARARDSVVTRQAEWRAWALAQPTATAPRLALAMLSRFDLRYADAREWLDSAARVATTPVWRSAVARERVSALLARGEFSELAPLLIAANADADKLPPGELAELRFVQLAYQRRVKQFFTLQGLDSVAAITPDADTVLRARMSCLRAVVDRPRMLEHAEAAIALATAAGVSFVAANCQLVLGTLYAGEGSIGTALVWFVRAEAAARAARDESTLAAALQWHGHTLRTVGYVRSARLRLTEAIRVAQRADDRNTEAWALLGISGTARLIGDYAAASTSLRRAAMLFDATGDPIGSINASIEEAQSRILLGDFAGASRLATLTKLVGDSLHQTAISLRSRYVLSDLALRENRLADAAAMLEEAGVLATIRGAAWTTQADLYRGILALRREDYAESIRLLSAARDQYSLAQDLYRYNVNGSLALAHLRLGDSVRAGRTLIDANRELDAVRDTMALSGLRKVVSTPDAWGGSGSSIDQVLAAFVTSSRWLPTVFAVTERARSRALLSGSLGAETTFDSSAIRVAQRRIRATATILSDVQKALKPTTALLVYGGGTAGARTSLMIVTKTSARGITLAPMDSLDRDIVRWLALLESGETGIGAGKRVAEAVLAGALRDLPREIKRLVIVPQGPLYRVPFQALPIGGGVLGDRAVVTISPSVSLALAYAAEPRSVEAHVLALGAGDTQVGSDTPQSLELIVERADRGNPLAPLLAAADEARAAAGWGTGSMSLTGTAASEAAFKRESRGAFTVLHAAAHALTSDQSLGANWLILRPDSTDDGYVSGGELADLTVGRAMVVLSGCRTTGDFGSRGDAIDGLVAPLLARGVRTVVASHWAVSDKWTKVLMERFYRNLATGSTTSDAMNQAQTSLRRAGVPARFWAAFSVIGDGALTFTTTATTGGGK